MNDLYSNESIDDLTEAIENLLDESIRTIMHKHRVDDKATPDLAINLIGWKPSELAVIGLLRLNKEMIELCGREYKSLNNMMNEASDGK